MKRRDFLKTTTAAVALAAGLTGLKARPAVAEDAVITIKGARMTPDSLTVKVGQTITIVDKDATSHSIFSETPGMEVQSKITPSGNGAITFDKAGVATVECAEHPTEIAKVTVVA